MKVFPIAHPVNGERVIGTHPAVEVFPDRDWRRRINNYTGRALTHSALRMEQDGRDGRMATLGQIVSPGVVTGLEAEPSEVIVSGEIKPSLEISPGFAVCASGEAIRLSRALRTEIRNVRVCWLTSIFDAIERGDTLTPDMVPPSGLGPLAPRKVGETLEDLINRNAPLPKVAILVLQPIVADVIQQPDRGDPCELDPENFAFENWQLIDGCRLVWYFWPEEWQILPVPGDRWRNRTAHTIFERERNAALADFMPWEAVGVPLSLVGFDNNWNALFFDRNAVVRSGGQPKRRTGLFPGVGNHLLWQAQFEQFNEQLAEIVLAAADAATAVTDATNAFRYLPPVGVLPNSFVDARAGHHEFFPANYHVEAIAVPIEQLDVVVSTSESLALFDTFAPDRVQVVVPVPQTFYEPDILQVEVIDPEFDQTITRFTDERNQWLGRRLDVRRKAAAIVKGIRGKAFTYRDPDPDAVDDLELQFPFESALIEVGADWHYFKGIAAPPAGWAGPAFDASAWEFGATGMGFGVDGAATKLDDMRGNYTSIFLRKAFTLTADDLLQRFELRVATTGGYFVYLNGKRIISHNVVDEKIGSTASSRNELEWVTFDLEAFKSSLQVGNNVIAILGQTDAVNSDTYLLSPRLLRNTVGIDIGEDAYGTELRVDATTGAPILSDAGEPIYNVLLVDELKTYLDTKTPLSEAEITKLGDMGVERYIEFLQRKVDRASDKIDYGFVRVQTDIYRVRQLMLGNVEGTRLATSPVLAAIAKGETATATRQEITNFIKGLKQPTGTGLAGLSASPEPQGGPASQPLGAGIEATASRDVFLSGELVGGIVLGGKGITDEEAAILGRTRTPPLGFESSTAKETIIAEAAGSGRIFATGTATKKDIEEQTRIIGGSYNFHNVTVGERLKEPLANESKSAGVASKGEVVQSFLDMDLNVDDLEVPGFRAADGTEIFKSFKDIRDGNLVKDILNGAHDANAKDESGKTLEDEGAFFNAGVRALENTTSILRMLEGRTHAYKRAIDQCRQTLIELRQLLTQPDRRLKIIGDELAEARHDVSMSRALKAEEQSRIDGINERRDQILAEHVPYLVFCRPRLSYARVDTPARTLNPDLSEVPLPACTADADEAPPELDALVQVLREAPLKWFKFSKGILYYLDRLVDLRAVLKSARVRARTKAIRHPYFEQPIRPADRFAQGIGRTILAANEIILAERRKTRDIELGLFERIGWREAVTTATTVISLGDVIDGNHGRTKASRFASRELDQIARMATCLYLRFGEVLPSIRLDWAERLSQFDAPINLRNLYALPRWGEIDFIERNQIQMLVDWLYQRVDVKQSEAVALISDLVRICVLLASHAPVRKIIAGRLPKPTVVRVGGRVAIDLDLSRVRVGMNVVMESAGKVVASGVIEDLVAGQASIHVLKSIASSVSLDTNTKVQVGAGRALGEQYSGRGAAWVR